MNIEIDMKNILGALGLKPKLSSKWTIEEVQSVIKKYYGYRLEKMVQN